MQNEPVIYLNGKFVPKSKAAVSVFDHGLLYGDGVFEGVRAYNGSVFQLDEHIKRLYESAKFIQLKVSLDAPGLEAAVLETVRRNNLRDAYIRIVVTRGVGNLGVNPESCKEPTVFVIAEPAATSLGQKEPRTVRTIISSLRRDAVDATTHEVKSLNYLNSILAKIEANNAGVDDSIMLDARGFVSEGSVTNVFLVKERRVFTPSPASAILHGITRKRIIRLCYDLGLEVLEKDITPFELVSADELFLVGTKAEILAIGSVNGRKIGSGGPGPITRKLLSEFGKLVGRPEEGTPIYEKSVEI